MLAFRGFELLIVSFTATGLIALIIANRKSKDASEAPNYHGAKERDMVKSLKCQFQICRAVGLSVALVASLLKVYSNLSLALLDCRCLLVIQITVVFMFFFFVYSFLKYVECTSSKYL